jgi:hypothetical protein
MWLLLAIALPLTRALVQMTLDDALRGYQVFKDKEDGCIRAVFRPHA